MAVYYIFSDQELLSRVRKRLTKTLGITRISASQKPVSEFLDTKALYNDALLCSIYAEILRLHGMVHFLVSARQRTDLQLGR